MSANTDKKPQEAAVTPKKPGGMGLGGMKLSGLLKTQAAAEESALKELDLTLIDEDPHQSSRCEATNFGTGEPGQARTLHHQRWSAALSWLQMGT